MRTAKEIKQRAHAYYLKHRATAIQKAKLWNKEHPERVRARYRKNRATVIARAKQWFQDNKERALQLQRRWRKEHPDHCKKYMAKWAKEHPEEMRRRHKQQTQDRKQWRILKPLITEVVDILETVETTDDGREFRPTNFTSCRTVHCQRLGEIWPKIVGLVRGKGV